jgi:hypothetical protein
LPGQQREAADTIEAALLKRPEAAKALEERAQNLEASLGADEWDPEPEAIDPSRARTRALACDNRKVPVQGP